MHWTAFLVFMSAMTALATSAPSTTSINVIVIIIGDNPAYGYRVQAPAYEASFSNVELIYPDILQKVKRYMIYKPGMYSCSEAAAMTQMVAGELDQLIRRLNGTTILISPGCSLEILTLGDFAREWDVALLSPISTDLSLANRDRYPSVISFTPTDYPSYIAGLLQFLLRFNWTTTTLICDEISRSPLGTFFQTMCSNIRRLFEQSRETFLFHKLQIDSSKNSSIDYDNLLAQARRQCRVIVVVARPQVLRKLMVSAYRANMTSGDYIFIAGAATKVPIIEDVTWKYGDLSDDEARYAFRSLILVSSPNPDWDRIDPLLESIRNTSREKYNVTQTIEQKRNDLTVCAYEVVASLAEVLNDTADRLPTEKNSGMQLASLFLNRTFALSSRDAYIASNGVRASDVVFIRLNSSTDQFQTAWRYLISSKTLVVTSTELAADWVGPDGPPLNMPPCGLLNEICFTAEGKKLLAGSIGGTLGGLVVVLIVLVTVWLYRRLRYLNDNGFDPWWCLEVSLMGHNRHVRGSGNA